MPEKIVLFVCVHNAGRSLMAEALFNSDPPAGWRAISGGTSPADHAHPATKRLLEEIGLELPPHPPQLATPEQIEQSNVRITMGCLDDAACPSNLKTLKMTDWALADPAQLDEDGARKIRDQIRDRVRGLRTELVLRERRSRSTAASSQ